MVCCHPTILTNILVKMIFLLSIDLSQTLSMSRYAKKPACVHIMSISGYDCMGQDLVVIPQDLSTSIKILDVSFNRIRELRRDMFKHYPYLNKLYLNDNMIMTIEPDTFEDLFYLDTLDLSVNALMEIPLTLLNMPSLSYLMLSNNIRLNIAKLFDNAAPITSPIQYLDISYNPLLTSLPNFGVMMDLVHLNISGIRITNVSIANFIGLCNLKLFTNNNLTMDFSSTCGCVQLAKWFEVKNIVSTPPLYPHCEVTDNRCRHSIEPEPREHAIYEKCITDFENKKTLKSASQICLIVFGVTGSVILIVGICYVYYRFQRLTDNGNKNIKNKNEKVNIHLLITNNEAVNN